MNKKFTLICILAVIGLVLFQTSGNEAISNTSGSPAGRTGSPADGQTCATGSCHAGSASASPTQIITSNVPTSGYVPGQTYTITASVAQAGVSKFGFQISPQSSNGTLLGQLIITNTSQTKIVSTKYVTHQTAGTSGSGSKTWSFNWVAPAAGTGNVTFYGAFNFTNGNGQSNGDIVRTNTLVIPEASGVGIAEVQNDVFNATVFPNPADESINVRFTVTESSPVTLTLTDLKGSVVGSPNEYEVVPGTQEITLVLPTGMQTGVYRMIIEQNGSRSVKSVFKK